MANDRMVRWLTIGANLGVIIGLGLVIAELNQNRDMMRAQTRHEMAIGIVELLAEPAGNPQLAGILHRAQIGEDLSPVENYQFELRTNALFRYWEDVHYQYRVGLYDETEFDRQRDAWRTSFSNSERARAYWCKVRTLYSPRFMSEMDELIIRKPC